MIDLNELKKKAHENSKKRAENGGTKPLNTFNLLKHCATEVIEATEAHEKYSAYYSDYFSDELCDIICCVLIIAENEKIECIEKNRKRAEGVGDKK